MTMKFNLKEIIKSNLQYPVYFYGELGNRLFLVTALIIIVGFLDGLGLSMFLPLLQMVDGSQSVDPGKFGQLNLIFEWISKFGLQINLGVVLIFLCVFFLLKGIVVFIGNAYRVTVQKYFIKKIRIRMLNSLSGIRYKSFMTSDVGRIQNTMGGEISRLAMALTSYLQIVQNIILTGVYITFAAILNIEFSLIVVAGIALLNSFFRQIYKRTKEASRGLTAESHKYQGWLIQFIANFKYLKATGTLNKLRQKLLKQIVIIEQTNKKIGILSSVMSSVREPSMIFVVALAVFIQTKFLGSPLSSILVSLLFFYRALSSIVTVQTHWNTFLSVSGSMENIRSFQSELEQTYEKKGETYIDGIKEDILLENVAVSFGDNTVLENISLEIRKNETIAIVGESGSGKTTLVNVIAGLLPVDSGRMKIDGIDSRFINMESYQSHIGYITQEPVIFNASIFENITFWDERIDGNIQRFHEAVRKAAIFDFIETLTEKEQTELGNNGINISGGQKQRISIARELYKDLDILIMDEATSALDSETERSIQDNIDVLKGTYTILIVAHRLSTVKNADRIVLMNQGKIINTGDYHTLLDSEPIFKRMVSLQELF
jgi:ABC-type multidrug transport system fused ATPase/permease subunit